MDHWLQLKDVAKMFGLSQESIKRLANSHDHPFDGLPLLQLPAQLNRKSLSGLKAQPRVGPPVRNNRRKPKSKGQSTQASGLKVAQYWSPFCQKLDQKRKPKTKPRTLGVHLSPILGAQAGGKAYEKS
jgi:hypothetical protein